MPKPKLTPTQVRLLRAMSMDNPMIAPVFSPWPTASLRSLTQRGLIDRPTLTLTPAGREALAEVGATS